MIEVSKTNNVGTAQNVKKRISSAVGNFSDFLNIDEMQEAEKPLPTNNLTALNFLNEVEDEDDRKKKKQTAITHGKDVLEDLTRIQNGLLTGGLSQEQLQRIQQKIAEHKQGFIDPKLDFIINEIEVRAAVELAKFGVF